MPREYIARLIYDQRHESILLLSTKNSYLCSSQNTGSQIIDTKSKLSIPLNGKNSPDSLNMEIDSPGTIKTESDSIEDKENLDMSWPVLGGITMRQFGKDVPFLEIVFCAISSTEQVRGYGAFLMSVLKTWVMSAHPHIQYFLTYADNYAVGYFKKQGFSRQITLDRSIWGGLIKDYDGGTLMECYLLPGITNYRAIKSLLDHQKEALFEAIKMKTPEPFIKHSGLTSFPIDPHSIPGLSGRSWITMHQPLQSQSSLIKESLSSLLIDLQVCHIN